MPKKANKAQRRKDKYYQLAKEQGYRARSAFKLIQLNKKYDFLAKSSVCIDLCAAPGGWLQVAAKYMHTGATIIGVDLMPIKPIRGVITHQEDITTPECRAVLKRDLSGRLADVILHDGAPNVGQNWSKDAFTQSTLVLCALKLATEFLRPHGLFITKVFRSADYNSLLWVFHQLFNKVEATKPHSSRNASAEIFVACRDYKAPDKIDPRLLDPKYVFKDIDELAGTATGLAGGGGGGKLTVLDKKAATSNKRHRDGYDEKLGPLLMRRLPVIQFLRSDNAVRTLTDASCFTFDDETAAIGIDSHPATTDEIRACCDDLKLLGKKEFKLLLKWRFLMRKAFPQTCQRLRTHEVSADEIDLDSDHDAGSASVSDEDAEVSDEDDHDMAELSAAAADELRRRKREKKRDMKLRAKALRRQRLGMNLRSVDVLDSDNTLFSLDRLKKAAKQSGMDEDDVLDAVRDVDLEDASDLDAEDSEIEDDEDAGSSDDGEEADPFDAAEGSVAERLKAAEDRERLDEVEAELDHAYAVFLAKRERREKEGKEGESKGIKLTRRQRMEKQALLTEAALNGQLQAEEQKYLDLLSAARKSTEEMVARAGDKRRRDEDEDEDEDEDDEEGSGADEDEEELDDADEGEAPSRGAAAAPSLSASTRAARWFSRDIFADVLADEVLDEGSRARARASDDEDKPVAAVHTRAKAAGDAGDDDEDEDDDIPDELAEEDDWLAGVPKSEREKRKERLRKRREKEQAAAARRAAKEDIKVVAGGTGAQDDADIEFARVLRAQGGRPVEQDDDDDEALQDPKERKKRELLRAGLGKMATAEDDGGFEVVPAARERRRAFHSDDDDSEDSDSEADEDPADSLYTDPQYDPSSPAYDADAHAELLALGKQLKRHSTAKALMDASYNRYSFDDPDNLPQWFTHDERKHFHAQLPISKSEIESIKAKFRDIAARPVAKVAEARARKRRRVLTKLEKAKKQAEGVIENEELQGRSKAKALAKLYRGAEVKRPSSVYVVAGKSGGQKGADAAKRKAKKSGGRVKVVDPRLKKDKRALKRANKRARRA